MKNKKDILFIFVSLIVGFITGVIIDVVCYKYNVLALGSCRVLNFMIYMVCFALVVGFVLLIKGLINKAYVNFGKVMALTLAAVLVFTGVSALFEFLYEINPSIKKTSTTNDFQYIFLVDDSGSMDSNDPENERYDAVEKIINGLDADDEFAVYKFASNVKCSTPLGSENPQNFSFTDTHKDGGGTNILTAVEQAMKENKGSWGTHTKIIILTDGIPSDDHLGKRSSVVRKCNTQNTSISSIGFGSPSDSFLQNLADQTGGTYVRSDNISNLTNNLETVVQAVTFNSNRNRDLLSSRLDHTATSVLHGILRVLFLGLLGAVWSIIKMLLVGERKYTKSAMVTSIVMCAVAGLLVELYTLVYVLPPQLIRILFCTMWACTIIPKNDVTKVEATIADTLNTKSDDANGRSLFDDFNDKSQEVGGPKWFE